MKSAKTGRGADKSAEMGRVGNTTMGDTQLLLSKIAALRQRLEQARSLTSAPEVPVACRVSQDASTTSRVEDLQRRISAGAQHHALLDGSLRQMADTNGPVSEEPVWPSRLTVRGRRLLERGRDLVHRLRDLSDDPLLSRDDTDPLDVRFRETASMTDTALRMVQAFPDAPSAQIRLCDGLEAILDVVDTRLASLAAAVAQRRRETTWVDRLADLLTRLDAGRLVDIQPFLTLAEEVLAEAQDGACLRFLHAGPEQPARFIAAHSLTVAQVVARIVRQDPDLRGRPLEPLLAALLHDVGMLRVPADILAQPAPLADDQRRAVEAHTRTGADLAARLWPAAGWLADAVLGHHERLDGTGYPGGLRDAQVPPINRLLAVCEVYAALCLPRPYRPARETRTAMTDTLLLAEQGVLDRFHAERLLALSFYPAGSVVELADGAVALVVATPLARGDLNNPARPVVVVLTDAHGRQLPAPHYVDLAQVEGRSIVRSLSPAERRRVLARDYPEAA